MVYCFHVVRPSAFLSVNPFNDPIIHIKICMKIFDIEKIFNPLLHELCKDHDIMFYFQTTLKNLS